MVRRLITDLDARLVKASESILLEIMTLLGAYRKSLVLVGGWVPYFITAREYLAPLYGFVPSLFMGWGGDESAINSSRNKILRPSLWGGCILL